MSQYNLPEAFNRVALYASGVTVCAATLISNAGSGNPQSILVGGIAAALTYAGCKTFAEGLQTPPKKVKTEPEPKAALTPDAPTPG